MRGKGEGAVYRVPKDKTKPLKYWVGVVELPGHGKDRRRVVIRRKDKEKLLTEHGELLEKLHKHGDLPNANQTAAEWFAYWLDTVAPREIRPKTLNGYRSVINNHVIPNLGKVKLNKLGPAHIRRVTDAITDTWKNPKDHSKGKLSSTYALNAQRVMSTSLTDAEREGRIQRNPAKLARAPRKSTKELEVLTTDEAARLIGMFGDSPDAYMWAVFLLTGMRRGELLGLEWDRVTDVIDLSWQLQRHKVGGMVAPADYEYRQLTDGLYLTRPKSNAGKRIIPLVPPLSDLLDRWRLMADTNPYGLVFTTSGGQPIDPDRATKEWPAVLAAAGIHKHVRIHDLRHTAVDLLYEAGVPEDIIVEIVGHSSRAQTQSYKSKGNRPQLTAAMLKLSALITPKDAD